MIKTRLSDRVILTPHVAGFSPLVAERHLGWPGAGSLTTGVSKKSRTWHRAGGILTGPLRGTQMAG
jgi:hypothetical protein